jgi:hypothetical protein
MNLQIQKNEKKKHILELIYSLEKNDNNAIGFIETFNNVQEIAISSRW